MTPHGTESSSAPSPVDAPAAGAPAIYVTSEMLECGFRELLASGITDDPWEVDKLLVERIYRAMEASRLQAMAEQ